MNRFCRFVTILSSVLMLSSCGDDSIDAVTEEISVSPSSLELSAKSGGETVPMQSVPVSGLSPAFWGCLPFCPGSLLRLMVNHAVRRRGPLPAN